MAIHRLFEWLDVSILPYGKVLFEQGTPVPLRRTGTHESGCACTGRLRKAVEQVAIAVQRKTTIAPYWSYPAFVDSTRLSPTGLKWAAADGNKALSITEGTVSPGGW